MATPNTSMTATGLGNAEESTSMEATINQELIETLDRYGNSGGEDSVDKSPGEQQQKQGEEEDGQVGGKQQVEEEEEQQSQKDQGEQQQSTTTAAEVMCS